MVGISRGRVCDTTVYVACNGTLRTPFVHSTGATHITCAEKNHRGSMVGERKSYAHALSFVSMSALRSSNFLTQSCSFFSDALCSGVRPFWHTKCEHVCKNPVCRYFIQIINLHGLWHRFWPRGRPVPRCTLYGHY